MLGTPKLRDSHILKRPYPVGKLNHEALITICQSLVYQMAIGDNDISGEKWEKIFAKGINGSNLSRPLGLADVVKDNFSWSVKTVKQNNPHSVKKVRIISGRNNINYSFGIANPLEDIEKTGKAVLSIFNERIKAAKSEYKDLTHSILVRSPELDKFTYFEKEAETVDPNTVTWSKNKNGNLVGHDASNRHVYTWQTDGSQFTIIYQIPDDAIKFSLKKPQSLDFDSVIELVGFDESWVEQS